MRSQSLPYTKYVQVTRSSSGSQTSIEVLNSLNTGIVASFDNTPLFSLAAGWIEPVTHYTLSRHIYNLLRDVLTVFCGFVDPGTSSDRSRRIRGEAAKRTFSVRKLEGELLETIAAMGKEVVTLTQAAENLPAVKRKDACSLLENNPEMQELYGAVKKAFQSLK